MFDNLLLSSQGLTARRDPANKVCYVSKLDSSFPSPGKMKVDMDQVSFDEKFSVNNWQSDFPWNTNDFLAIVS